MSSTATRRRKRAHVEEEHENEERWLVSFADMMTLLFCLFMVLFAISSVNTSKFESLQRSLQEAFSGAVMSGGKQVMETGSREEGREAAVAMPPMAVSPVNAPSTPDAAASAAEEQQFDALKRRVDEAAAQLGLKQRVQTTVSERGLVVRLRTDGMFFAPGRADLQPAAEPLVRRLARLIATEARHPVVVEGYTDSTPIATGVFPSNWELSGARASSVMRALFAGGVQTERDGSVRGFAERHPVASNATAAGRAANRRVEVVLTRLHRRTP